MDSRASASSDNARNTRSNNSSVTALGKDVFPKPHELKPKLAGGRIPSPTRLPVGSIRRSESVRQSSANSASAAVSQIRTHSRQTNGGTKILARPSHNRSVSDADRGTVSRASAVPRNRPATSGLEPRSSTRLPPRRASASGSDKQALDAVTQSVKSRTRSQQSVPAASTESPSQVVEKRRGSTSISRPQFNNLQKDYAPRKSSSITTGAAQNTDTLESTLDLSQMHAIHSKSAEAQGQWVQSAKNSYERCFLELVDLSRNLEDRERSDMFQKNAQTIIEWVGKGCSDTLDRRIKVISTVLDEFWHLSGPQGRYSAAVFAFEHWYNAVSEAQNDNANMQNRLGGSTQMIGGLGDGWKAEVDSLQDQLLQTAQQVLSLGELDSDAELARCISLLSEMIQNMLEELETLVFIEQSVVLQEQYWMQASIDELSHALSNSRLAV